MMNANSIKQLIVLLDSLGRCFQRKPLKAIVDQGLVFFRPLTVSICLSLFVNLAVGQEKDLAALLPRIPPKSVEEAEKSFKLECGFSLELVAAEPDVVNPVDAAFDERGRMFVAEMIDYPFLPEQRVQKYRDQRAETWGRIRLLTDSDGDGQMDKSVVFADKLRWPQSVCCSRGGVFVIAPPHLYYMKDTDGDDVADLQEIVCSGFNSTNVQALSNGLEWGRDNAIYFASGIAGGELTVPARGDKPEYKFTPGRRDLRLDPDTREFTLVSGGQQFGHTIDDWGERFVCSNSNHIVHATWPLNYLERNPLLTVPDTTRSIAKEGAAAVVFRASSAEPWRLVRTARRAADPEMKKRLPPTELVPIGFFTSATGITVYRGGAYPQEFHGDVFIGDCGGNLVHRKKLTPDGISFVATRADRDVEFLTSTDNWFRPVNFVNAPDGTLYVLDMYRETIEHPASIPDDIKALVDLESGYDKGRIWRLVPPGFRRKPPPNLASMRIKDLVTHLESPDGWVRDTSQRLLVEKQDRSAIEDVRRLLRDESSSIPQQANDLSKLTPSRSGHSPSPSASRVHQLYALKGLKALQAEDVRRALLDSNEHLREVGLRLLPEVIGDSQELAAILLLMVDDASPRVRWQLAFTLGEVPAIIAVPVLKKIAIKTGDDPDLRMAWLSSCYSNMGTLAVELVASSSASSQKPNDLPVLNPGKPTARSAIPVELGRLIGSAADPSDCLLLLDAVVNESVSDEIRIPVLLALEEGRRRRGSNIAKTLVVTNANPMILESIRRSVERASVIVRDPAASEGRRLAGVRLLALGDSALAERTLVELFTPQSPPALQQAAVKTLATFGTPKSIALMLEPWRSFGPGTRREVVDSLVDSVPGALSLLKAIETASIKPGEIERDKRQLLLNHPQAVVRDAAKRVLSEPPSNRKQVVTDYQPALDLTGDADRGRLLYVKTCSQCHRAGTTGHQVGPDFTSVQNKSSADLLVAILDPNREAQPNYQTYTAVTKQGKVHTGIIATETAASLTLKRSEAKEEVVLRDTIDELVSNGVSLMPEGLEKDLNQQQLADIIAAIRSGQ